MTGSRRIAFYARVSSDEQRERQTIQNQIDALQRQFAAETDVTFVAQLADDGVSGTIPLRERPQGHALLEAAERGAIDEVWVTRADRLGRDTIDLFHVWDTLKAESVKLVGVEENLEDEFHFDLLAVIAKHERQRILARMKAGMTRIVADGKYPGGIVAYGYTVVDGRITPDETIVWGDWSATEVIRRIFRWASDGRSSRWIAEELNRLGVPTAYRRAGPGSRRRRTESRWWPGRIQQILTNATYAGTYIYGKRAKAKRELISAEVPPLVSEELWDLARKQMGKRSRSRTGRVYLLRSRIVCGLCGLKFTGTRGHGTIWYRCNGQLTGRGPDRGRCPAKAINGDILDDLIWADIEQFLRDPGQLLQDLAGEADAEAQGEAGKAEAQRITLDSELTRVDEQCDRILDLYQDGQVERGELDRRLDALHAKRRELKLRRAAQQPCDPEAPDIEELRDELLQRLDDGLTDQTYQEVAQLLVRRIVVNTTDTTPRKKRAKVTVEYAFVAPTPTGRGSWRRRA